MVPHGVPGPAVSLTFLCALQAVGLRGYAQRDPLVEYKLEGYNLFVEMMANIRRNVIYNVYMFSPEKARRSDSGAAAEKEAAKANA